MKNQILPLIFFLLMITSVYSGCVGQNPDVKIPESSPGPSVTTPTPVYSTIPALTETTGVPVFVVNYTAIRFIGEDDPAHPMNEQRKNAIAKAAIADDRVRTLLADGGMIKGVLYQCHPTPKDYADAACAPALRVLHNGTAWDFLVDEKSQVVIFVQHEIPSGSSASSHFREN